MMAQHALRSAVCRWIPARTLGGKLLERLAGSLASDGFAPRPRYSSLWWSGISAFYRLLSLAGRYLWQVALAAILLLEAGSMFHSPCSPVHRQPCIPRRTCRKPFLSWPIVLPWPRFLALSCDQLQPSDAIWRDMPPFFHLKRLFLALHTSLFGPFYTPFCHLKRRLLGIVTPFQATPE